MMHEGDHGQRRQAAYQSKLERSIRSSATKCSIEINRNKDAVRFVLQFLLGLALGSSSFAALA
jgi:hypothetical protein